MAEGKKNNSSIYDILSSKGLAVVLFALLAGFIGLGTLILQNEPRQDYIQIYGSGLTGLIFSLKLNDMFHTFYFQGLLVAFACNLFLCAIKRKFTIANIGFHMVHFGVIVTLIGSLVGTLAGDGGMLWLDTGQASNKFMAEKGGSQYPVVFDFTLKLDRFEIEYKDEPEMSMGVYVNEGGEQMKYLATFPMKDGGKQPMPELGYTIETSLIYPDQNTKATESGAKDQLVVMRPPAANMEFPLDLTKLPGGPFKLDDEFDIIVTRYEPDVRVGEAGEIYSESQEPKNPGLQVTIRKGAEEETRWLFSKFPGHAHGSKFTDIQVVFGKAAAPSKDPSLKIKVTDKDGKTQEKIDNFGPDATVSALFGKIGVVANSKSAIGDYKSYVSVIEGEKVVQRHLLEVNDPLIYNGFHFYQSSYRQNQMGEYTITGIEVKRDPGLIVVFIGFISILVGTIWIFYLQQYLRRRKKK